MTIYGHSSDYGIVLDYFSSAIIPGARALPRNICLFRIRAVFAAAARARPRVRL